MKRLLQISFDTLLSSIIPILIWNALGFILTKDLLVIFEITYPIQFLFYILYYIFGVGPNITAEKRKNKDITYTNIYLGTMIGLLVFIFLTVHCNQFLTMMSSDISTFRIFTIYSFGNLFLTYVLKLILEKLYYEKENKKANTISILFYLCHFSLLILLAIFTNNQVITAFATLLVMSIALLILLILNTKKFKINISFLSNIKTSSIGIVNNIMMFFIYFIGNMNSFAFGPEYILASTFTGIVSDTQWDIAYSIDTAVHIDVSKGQFHFKESLKNGYKLVLLLILTSVIMTLSLYYFYKPNVFVFSIYFLVQIIDLLFFPISTIRQQYLQIQAKETNTKPTIHAGIAKGLRLICSFIRTPFCTYIGQIVEMTYNYIYTKIVAKNIPDIKI